MTDAPIGEAGLVDDQPAVVVPALTLRRAPLLEEMPEDHFSKMVELTRGLIERRFQKVRSIISVADSDVNLNPFLMLAMAPAYNIFSPYEAAEYVQMAKMLHGDSGAFGTFIEKLFMIFGAIDPPEKSDPDEAVKTLFCSIDLDLTVGRVRHLFALKSGRGQ